MHPRARHGLLALALTAALSLGTTPATASSSGSPSGTPGSRAHSSAAASRALARAHALFAPARSAQRRTPSSGTPHATAGGRREATLVLRDLAARLDEMTPSDRTAARAILARPTEGANATDPVGYAPDDTVQAICSTHVCVHWTTTGDQAVPATDTTGAPDGGPDGVPDQVALTDRVLEQVWAQQVGTMGYLAPRADAIGGSYADGTPFTDADTAKLDVYLVDSGSLGLYGYCAPDLDSPHTASRTAAYCALDNDFSTSQFAGNPVTSLKATAAHEFFHAVQFGYDAGEDVWLMESTAAWMESQVYPAIHDNRQFLSTGPLGHPGIPLDYFDPNPDDPGYYPQYGGWVFWQLAGETFGPGVVRDVWTRAQRSGQYSLTALKGALAARHTDLTTFFARFGAVNHYPGRAYRHGSLYRVAPLAEPGPFVMTPKRMSAGPIKRILDHLTNKTVRFRPGAALRGRRALRLVFNLGSRYRASAATVVVHLKDGTLARHAVGLDRHGEGHLRVPFSRARVSFVEVTLTNASTRYHCYQRVPVLSCEGVPLDDSVKDVLSARVVAG